ncbi:MAG: O-acetylhomoserine aminocarboxypropyltransferase/cysteine synthase [Clostridiales bacterium]|nr:O-acetylhomoserine aminocarboxypropyltransferase/cysteine synthase [Clostridiales bacterium]MDD7035384.1 O-acetylhomoserine aminocarboxypropyltransferase/cysteine synthase [Bacillota bacterium]MDY2920813.1 O-acetylhomoserine aminocarboxypropyltransferase/cysteine synthase family protein [Lentihominibacter sp.]
MKNKGFETKCVHGAYQAESGQPQNLPIVQSTTYRYYNGQDVAELFDLDSPNHMYARLGSPTVDALEQKMALLENGTAGMATSSGQSANLIALLNICQAGDHIISATNIYGGTYNLFAVTMKKMGIDVEFIDQDISAEEIVAHKKPNTRALFGETLGNPALSVLDIEKFARAAGEMGVPLIVDNTLATPALCRPIDYGADIVTHSTTKFSDGHGTSVGGCVIESGRFDWNITDENGNKKYPSMAEPDESYHGLNFYEKFGEAAFCTRLKAVLVRDLGCTMAPMNAYLTHQGLQTLDVRMERHVKNAKAVAEYLNNHPKIDWVVYPGLEGDKYYEEACKYMPKGAGAVMSFVVKGGRAAGEKLMECLKLSSIVVHVGDIRTSVLHPASTTHRQLSEEAQLAAGIDPGLIRLSVGLETLEDIIADFEQALEQI